MSLRQWFAMFAFYAMYVFLGASIFYTMEHNLETERRAVHLQERIDINGEHNGACNSGGSVSQKLVVDVEFSNQIRKFKRPIYNLITTLHKLTLAAM